MALSTLRHLGLIICRVGLGSYKLAFFHLLRHAYFKSIIFIATGHLIHANLRVQDLRKRINTTYLYAFTIGFLLVASLSIRGFPYLRGFGSKHLILELLLNKSVRGVLAGVFYITLIFRVRYRFRFMYMCMRTSWHSKALPEFYLVRETPLTLIRLLKLGRLAVIGGTGLVFILGCEHEYTSKLVTSNLRYGALMAGLILCGVVVKNKNLNLAKKISIFSLGSMWSLPYLRGRYVGKGSLQLGEASSRAQKQELSFS